MQVQEKGEFVVNCIYLVSQRGAPRGAGAGMPWTLSTNRHQTIADASITPPPSMLKPMLATRQIAVSLSDRRPLRRKGARTPCRDVLRCKEVIQRSILKPHASRLTIDYCDVEGQSCNKSEYNMPLGPHCMGRLRQQKHSCFMTFVYVLRQLR